MINLTYVKQYCEEYRKIENYKEAVNDQTQMWHCHHRHEIDWDLPKEELIAIGRYYDVHYSELIFLTPKEHNILHKKGKHHTEETKQKMKGNQNPLKYHITAEELYDLYVVQGLSIYKIAEMYGCNPTTIWYKLKKFNITKNK